MLHGTTPKGMLLPMVVRTFLAIVISALPSLLWGSNITGHEPDFAIGKPKPANNTMAIKRVLQSLTSKTKDPCKNTIVSGVDYSLH